MAVERRSGLRKSATVKDLQKSFRHSLGKTILANLVYCRINMKPLETTNDERQRLRLIIETDVREFQNGIQLLGLIFCGLLEAGACRAEGDTRADRRICRSVLAYGMNVPASVARTQWGIMYGSERRGATANGGLL
jgi:hypothetical protein